MFHVKHKKPPFEVQHYLSRYIIYQMILRVIKEFPVNHKRNRNFSKTARAIAYGSEVPIKPQYRNNQQHYIWQFQLRSSTLNLLYGKTHYTLSANKHILLKTQGHPITLPSKHKILKLFIPMFHVKQ